MPAWNHDHNLCHKHICPFQMFSSTLIFFIFNFKEAFEKWNLLFQSNILHYPWSRETPRSFWNGPTRDAWIELKQPILMPTGQSLGNSITSSSLLCWRNKDTDSFPRLGWVSLNLWVFGNGFEDGRVYLSAKCQVLLFVMVPTHCFSSPLSGCKTIRDVVKRPLKYPNINKLGHFVLSPVRVSASLALALQHFCMGRWLPNLHLDMPAAGPGACLAHRWYECSLDRPELLTSCSAVCSLRWKLGPGGSPAPFITDT